jgi:DNA polymerase-1
MIALIDGDILLYTTAYQVERAIDWGDDMWTLHSDFREAKQRIDLDLLEFRLTLRCRAVRIALSDPNNNFRKKLLPSYKENRRAQRKPLAYSALRKYLIDVWGAKFKRGLEADDLLGMWSTELPGNRVIVSEDKDLRTIPGLLYSPRHPELGVFSVSEEEAQRNHLIQTLAGDATDGYSGCPGIGPVKAGKIVEGGWPAVVQAYADAGYGEEYALVQARMAYILRHGDYRRGKVRLWTPQPTGDAA